MEDPEPDVVPVMRRAREARMRSCHARRLRLLWWCRTVVHSLLTRAGGVGGPKEEGGPQLKPPAICMYALPSPAGGSTSANQGLVRLGPAVGRWRWGGGNEPGRAGWSRRWWRRKVLQMNCMHGCI